MSKRKRQKRCLENDINNNDSNEEILIDGDIVVIDDLEEHLLKQILSYLPIIERINVSQVCRKWKTIIEKTFELESVVNKNTVLGERQTISELALSLVIKKCPNVKHILLKEMEVIESDFSESNYLCNNLMRNIAHYCRQLETIDFANRKIKNFNKEFVNSVEYFAQMKKIVSRNISAIALNSIIDSPDIQCIDISNNTLIDVNDIDFKRLGTNVKQFYMSSIDVTEDEVRDLCEGNGKYLTHFSITVKDENVLQLICSQMKEINSLQLYYEIIDFNCDYSIVSQLSQLKTLKISFMKCHNLKDNEFCNLFRALKGIDLVEMKILLSSTSDESISNESLAELCENCPKLKKLMIRDANHLSGSGMYAIAELKSLKELDFMNGSEIDDKMENAVKNSSHLTNLNLHNCSPIDSNTLKAFIKNAKRKPYEKFSLDVTNTLAANILRRCEVVLPTNLKVIFRSRDCVYDCVHYGIDHTSVHSSSQSDSEQSSSGVVEEPESVEDEDSYESDFINDSQNLISDLSPQNISGNDSDVLDEDSDDCVVID